MSKPFTKSLIFSIVGGILVYFLIPSHFAQILNDENSIGWILGGLFTLYSLITAFVLVNVWTKFNDINEFIAKESQKIISLWNLTDYLNDEKITKGMKINLTKYLETVKTKELKNMLIDRPIVFASQTFIKIMKTIDIIKFDDNRDPYIFQQMITVYEELSEIRAKRLQLSKEQIPATLKLFFQIITISLILVTVLHPFNSTILYMIFVIGILFITSLIYLLIMDLDQPFQGTWNIDPTPLENAANYINKIQHTL